MRLKPDPNIRKFWLNSERELLRPPSAKTNCIMLVIFASYRHVTYLKLKIIVTHGDVAENPGPEEVIDIRAEAGM